MKRSGFRPFKQGYLDSLCGIYSVINATKYIVNNLSEDDLFYECLEVIEKRKGVLTTMTADGVNVPNMSTIFNKVIRSQYNIVIKKPFHKNRYPPLALYWTTIQRFLGSGQRNVVVLAIGGKDWSHWSVAEQATEKQLKLLDSDGMKILNRSYCTTKDYKKARYILYPSQTYFLTGGNYDG